MAGEQVDLVERRHQRLLRQVEVAQRLQHGLALLRRVRVSDVDDVHQDVGGGQLFERGAEGGDELRGQLLDEADGVGEEDGAAFGQLDAPGERVEGGEELVLGEDVGAGEGAHEGALAGVGVADERHDRHSGARPPAAVEGALAADGLDLALEAGDAVADEASVGLELRLAGAAGADGAFEPLQVAPLAGESRQEVLVLRQLDLEAAFAGLGASGEDVEDEGGAVEDLDLRGRLRGCAAATG